MSFWKQKRYGPKKICKINWEIGTATYRTLIFYYFNG